MASTLRHVTRLSSQISLKRFSQPTNFYHTTGVRYLFSADTLGISSYLRQKEHTQEKVGNLREKFRERMEEHMASNINNAIFTDDLKTIIYMADDGKELETALKMARRYLLQEDHLRFTVFHFGPLIMRMLHVLRKPKEAMEFIKDERTAFYFYHITSVSTFLDLLFEEGYYQEILDFAPELQNKQQLHGLRKSSDVLTVYTAACLKLNTPESYDCMMTMIMELKKHRQNPSMRTIVYAAQLALKQGQVEVAFQMLGLLLDDSFFRSGGNPPVAYTTIKAITLSRMGRVNEAINMVNGYVNRDTSDSRRPVTIFQELMEELTVAAEKSNDEVVKSQLNLLEKQIEEGSYLTKQTFDDYIFTPIAPKRQLQDGYRRRQRSPVDGFKSQSVQRSYENSWMD